MAKHTRTNIAHTWRRSIRNDSTKITAIHFVVYEQKRKFGVKTESDSLDSGGGGGWPWTIALNQIPDSIEMLRIADAPKPGLLEQNLYRTKGLRSEEGLQF